LPEGEGKGLYFPPSTKEGYHVIINGRTISVSKITELSRVRAYTVEEGYHWEYSIISEEEAAVDYVLEDCGLIYLEDDVWLEGEIDGQITLAAANLIVSEEEASVWLKGSISYKNVNPLDGFVLVSQHDVLITPDSPEYMDLQGVFIAQTGHFGTNHYSSAWYPSYGKKEELNIYGTIVSNGRVGTQWTSRGRNGHLMAHGYLVIVRERIFMIQNLVIILLLFYPAYPMSLLIKDGKKSVSK
jgi:hypothetical protein